MEHYLKWNIFVKNKLLQIPFGIPVNKYKHSQISRESLRNVLDVSPDTIVIGTVGHFSKEKGIDIVLKAYAELQRKIKNIKTLLVVLGTGNKQEIEYIHKLAQKLGTLSNTKFIGFDDNIEKWYSCFDIYMHGARKEAFGLVLIEAMSAKLPVIACSTGGIKDIVIHEKTGFLADTENVNQLAHYLLILTKDKELRIQLGNSGYKIANTKYSDSSYANNYITMYKNCS